MATMYIELMEEGGDKWRDWIKRENVTYESFEPFPMCDGIRLSGVSHLPEPKPEFVRYGK